MTFEDLLRRTKTDLRHWKKIIEADPSIGNACPEHTEELELEIKALEIAIEKEDEK